jgi:RNA polymerase sigma-70 factor (ECF subfamily)
LIGATLEHEEGKPMLAQSGSSEAELLRGAAAGKPASVRALLDGFGPAVYGFVYPRVGGHAEAAEDVTQETFIEAVRSASTFRAESSLRTWLCAIAKHRLSRHYEAERRTELLRSGLVAVPDPPVDTGADLERRDEVTRALGVLSPLHRQVLVLKYLDERSVEEIAAELGRSRVQVQSLLQRARVGLRAALEGGDGPD